MSKAPDTVSKLRFYRRLLAYAWPYKWVFLVAVIGMIVLSATAAGFTAVMKPLMDEGFVQRDASTIKVIPLLIVLLFLARGIGNFLAQYGTAWIGRRVTFDLRNSIFRRMLYLPSRYYESSASGGLISRIIYDVEQIAAGVTQVPYVVIGDGLTMLALAGWLLYLDWKLTLVFAVLLPVTALLMRAMNRRFFRTSREIQTSMGEISQVVREASDGQRVVKAVGGQPAEIRAFERSNEKNRRQSLRKAAVSAIGIGLLQLAGSIALGLVIYTALISGEITAGTFTSYLVAALWIMGPSRRLSRINETIQTSLAAAQSTFSVLDETPEEDTGSVTIERARGRVEYRHVGFRYPDAERDVLDDVSFTVEPGQVLALVGQSGSGKSTIASLLPRFYRAGRGAIRLDDTDINDLTLASLRRQIALVSQENILFDDSIRHNIAYGEEGAIDDARLMEAARAPHVLEFENSSDMISKHDTAGTFLYVSPACRTILGYEPEELTGTTVTPLVHPEAAKQLIDLVATPEWNDITVTVNYRARHKNGEYIWIETTARLFFDELNGQQEFQAASRNITERKEAEEQLQRAHADLQEAYDRTIEGWVRALDLRDKETEGHTQRVSELTIKVARRVGFTEENIIHIRRGALLHDIGKMAISDEILQKPGPLSEAEWDIMRRHPVIAFEMLSPIAYLQPALEIPYNHHERWDGSGYPRGLKKDEIPLTARLFAVIDVWDALCSDRPYRRKLPPGDVLEYIIDKSGVLFDPSIVVFLRFLASLALFPLVFPRSLRDLKGRTVADGLLLALPFYAAAALGGMVWLAAWRLLPERAPLRARDSEPDGVHHP